ncbi:MAG: glycosyltransferase family 9 protein [Veillonellaceae bacterium]|nr:glycosyltransferase family 9 protein [Veillonellaceae bacterium]
MSACKYSNILVYALDRALGDTILSTSAIEILKRKFPKAKITLMVRKPYSDLFKTSPILDEVLALDYDHFRSSLSYIIKTARFLRNRQFDLSLSLDHRDRAAILMFLAGIPTRVGAKQMYNGKGILSSFLFTRSITVPYSHDTHVTEFYQGLARNAFNMQADALPFIGKSLPDQLEKALRLFEGIPPNQFLVGLCLCGRSSLKSWPNSFTAELLTKLYKRYHLFFYVVGRQEDLLFADELINQVDFPIINLCGKTDLSELLAIIRISDLLITVDTATMHIAASADVPIVALFGPYSPLKWHPVSDKAAVLWASLPCSPCDASGADCKGEGWCMKALTVTDVFNKTAQQLATIKKLDPRRNSYSEYFSSQPITG